MILFGNRPVGEAVIYIQPAQFLFLQQWEFGTLSGGQAVFSEIVLDLAVSQAGQIGDFNDGMAAELFLQPFFCQIVVDIEILRLLPAQQKAEIFRVL